MRDQGEWAPLRFEATSWARSVAARTVGLEGRDRPWEGRGRIALFRVPSWQDYRVGQ